MRFLGMLVFGLEGVIPYYDQINDFIDNILDLKGYIDQAYTVLMNQDSITLVVGGLIVGIIFLLGAFDLIKKLSKILIVVAILAGLYLVYQTGALGGVVAG